MLFVCTAGEYEAAKKENMDPDCIGFRREYMISGKRAA